MTLRLHNASRDDNVYFRNIFKGSDNEDKLMNIIQCPLTVYTGSGQDIPSTKALQQDLKKSSHLILSINLLMKLVIILTCTIY